MLTLAPCTLEEANAFVARHHRHHQPTPVAKFSIAALLDDAVVGVVIVGLPKARLAMDGWTLEVTRLATDGTRNACSLLYGAARRAAFALGYTRVITYTLAEEGGASLKAAGFTDEGIVKGESWMRRSQNGGRFVDDRNPFSDKRRWSCGTRADRERPRVECRTRHRLSATLTIDPRRPAGADAMKDSLDLTAIKARLAKRRAPQMGRCQRCGGQQPMPQLMPMAYSMAQEYALCLHCREPLVFTFTVNSDEPSADEDIESLLTTLAALRAIIQQWDGLAEAATSHLNRATTDLSTWGCIRYADAQRDCAKRIRELLAVSAQDRTIPHVGT